MNLKIKTLAWFRTLQRLIKHRFDTTAALQETDQELSQEMNRVVRAHGYEAEDRKN
jgi:hypothetical protein